MGAGNPLLPQRHRLSLDQIKKKWRSTLTHVLFAKKKNKHDTVTNDVVLVALPHHKFIAPACRACLDGTLRSCLGYLPAWELPVLNCNIAWPGKNWNPGVVWLMA
jgi:hypothetical protein